MGPHESAAISEDASRHPSISKSLIAGTLGSIFEWYDFAVYAYFAPIIARLFFPAADGLTSLLATFGVFAVGFLARPAGSLVFGHLGDRSGRTRVLAASVLVMAIPTALIGLLPTYDQLGLAAPIAMTLLRIAQGLSVGGEMPGSVVFLVESAPSSRQGFAGSWAVSGIWVGVLLGSAMGELITTVFSRADVLSFAWRIPFLSGIVVGAIGFYIRRAIAESPTFESLLDSGTVSSSPIGDALHDHWRSIAATMLATYGYAVAGVTFAIYMATYLSVETGIPLGQGLEVSTIGLAVLAALCPVAGAFSDRVGRKPLILAGLAGILVFAYPGFVLLQHGAGVVDLATQLVFVTILAVVSGAYPAAMVAQFPAHLRVSGIALSYNTAFALFGGTAPLMATLLIQKTGSKTAPAFYLMFSAAISFAMSLRLQESE